MGGRAVHYINGRWKPSVGAAVVSQNPATGDVVWEGPSATEAEVNGAVSAASQAFPRWAALTLEERTEYILAFRDALEEKSEALASAISQEMGKPLWESRAEVQAMVGKIAVSLKAYDDRCPESQQELPQALSVTRHRPHGVIAVYGPFNFPGHLPNGHIVPALLAGNTIVFKPSEHTPHVGELMTQCWERAGLPSGVLNLVQGGRETGRWLSHHPDINGLFFTGSWATGKILSDYFATQPGKILALELGGNNPLVVWDSTNLAAAAFAITQSAFLTTGQRCTCARRLIISKDSAIIETLVPMVTKLRVGPWDDSPEPFMGPVISPTVARHLMEKQEKLIAGGAIPLLTMKQDKAFVTPAIIDVTACSTREDEELFGPLLQVIRVDSFHAALEEANNTAYGLAAGLISDSEELYTQFLQRAHAGIINWNMPTTGASSSAPFGGLGKSGNFRPSAYYAADYCAYPVASMERAEPFLPTTPPPGMEL